MGDLMATTPTVASGTTLSVCAALPATKDQAGFAALTYTQIRGVRSVADIGKTHQTAQRNPIGSPFSYQTRVGYSSGNVPLELIRIADAGQAILRAAVDASASYSYRLTQPDGMTLYFSAEAASRVQGTSGIADTKMTLEINSEIIEV